MNNAQLLQKASDIVIAYVGNHTMKPAEVVNLLRDVVTEMRDLNSSSEMVQNPAVPIEESYTDDYIICLEDGKKVTLLKRYLARHHDMTPEEYIKKWKLPEDYPMVTKKYSEKRSKIALDMGLGRS